MILFAPSAWGNMLDNNDRTIDAMVKPTDNALYRAKDKGRNCVETFS